MAKRILLVDEAPHTRALVAQALRARGYRVDECADGAAVAGRVEATAPNLVVLEALLPFKTGFEVRADLRSAPRTRHLPVLLTGSFTGRPRREDRSPADHFLPRPFGLLELLDTVQGLIGPAVDVPARPSSVPA